MENVELEAADYEGDNEEAVHVDMGQGMPKPDEE